MDPTPNFERARKARLLLDLRSMFGIGIQEFGLILVIALLVFGPKRLPELARMLGRGMGEFRRASNDLRQSLALDDLQNEIRRDLSDTPKRPAQAGDDLAPSSTSPSTSPSASQAGTGSVGENPGKHPGELPLGNDHEHHPDPDEALAEESGHGADEEPGHAPEAPEPNGAADPKRG